MQRYSSEPDDPWFRVGTIDVNSSLLVAALCTVSMLVYAIDKDLLAWLALISDNPFGPTFLHGVRQGQVWRVVTWPTFNPPEIWTFLSIVIIWYFGKELERFLGRVRYLWFVGIVVVFPSIVYVLLVPTLVAPTVIIVGSYMLASAMVIAFIATYPGAVGFFGVPFWIIAVVFEALRVLQLVGDRLWDNLLFLVVMMSTSLLMTRAFGLSELEWIPKIPLPASLSGESRRRAAKPGRSPRRGRKGPATVTPIRPPNSTPTSADLLRQAEIDVLLDKINEHGIGSLTPEERRRLDEHSRRMREER